MNKIIWTCWFQGRERAPSLVKKCLNSWERNNPTWEFRCLDASSLKRFIPLASYVDLSHQSITAASLSDIARILLLREFGGVWVDATLFCNRPLDEWLPGVMQEGFFAFSSESRDRPLASWFLSVEADNRLVSTWSRHTIEYWAGRTSSDDYFWFHHLFREMCEQDHDAARAWSRVPRVSADGPHALQRRGRMYRPWNEVLEQIDWNTPLFKLTHRLPEEGLRPGCLLEYLLARDDEVFEKPRTPITTKSESSAPRTFASLKVSTENLGDHIQIISGLALLSRLGVEARRYIDRDNEIQSAPGLDAEEGTVGILLNGWFKTNRKEWPPHPKLVPIILGFHIQLLKCPELMSDASIEFFHLHQPIGCRDSHTEGLLRSMGIEAFISNCLSLTIPRRIDRPEIQTEVFVASRDERIRDLLPSSLGPHTFVNHYSGSTDFEANMTAATNLLETYRSRAKLVVTTLLHCALPAIAMGIPVIVFYPINDERGSASDRERFSLLEGLVPIYRFEQMEHVNWKPRPVDVSEIKLRILDRFFDMASRWRIAPQQPLAPIATPAVLEPPTRKANR